MSLTEENGFRIQIQHPRISLIALNGIKMSELSELFKFKYGNV